MGYKNCMLGNRIPPEQRATGDLWLILAWYSGLGVVLLILTLPLLSPWPPSFAAALMFGFILLFEGFLFRGVWQIAVQLKHRGKG